MVMLALWLSPRSGSGIRRWSTIAHSPVTSGRHWDVGFLAAERDVRNPQGLGDLRLSLAPDQVI